jgi:hypothetical protein
MGLPAGPVPGVALVQVRFIHHIEALRRQGLGELAGDAIGGLHVVPVRARPCAGQCRRRDRISSPVRMQKKSSLEGVIGNSA